jgi:hypothetical protein
MASTVTLLVLMAFSVPRIHALLVTPSMFHRTSRDHITIDFPLLTDVEASKMSVHARRDASLDSKKRRRRRNDDISVSDETSNELPDFDLDTTDSSETSPASPVRTKVSLNPDEISDLMMGDPNMKVRSVKELIADRSLEKNFAFDDQGDESIPDFRN